MYDRVYDVMMCHDQMNVTLWLARMIDVWLEMIDVILCIQMYASVSIDAMLSMPLKG